MKSLAGAQSGRAGSPVPSHAPTAELLHASTRVSRPGGGSAHRQRMGDRVVRLGMGTLEISTGPAQRFRLVPSTVVGPDTQTGVHVTCQLGLRRRPELYSKKLGLEGISALERKA